MSDPLISAKEFVETLESFEFFQWMNKKYPKLMNQDVEKLGRLMLDKLPEYMREKYE